MVFSSIEFVVFFITVMAVCLLLDRFFPKRARECFLLLASYFFYGYWDWRFCFLLLFVTAAAYITAQHAKNKIAYGIGIVTPLVVLGIFKYFNFFLSSVSALIGHDIGVLKIILPVGISFYTFQALSYVIDVRREKIPVENDFIKVALYLSFFPQLVAGPIVKASDFLPQLNEERKITAKQVGYGVQLMAFGLFKKIVLADHISVFVDDIYRAPKAFHWATLLLAIIAYSIQIYLDFSGYSDIAIGCASCLGYDLNRNFNLPYISKNVTEFWRRWHISLSTWLREYVYIPLGGNRKGRSRQYINLFITMLLGGLWHGADWTFVFWGGLNGLALCIDKALPKREQNGFAAKFIKVLVTFAFITFTWIFFRADTFAVALDVIKGLVFFQNGIRHPFSWAYIGIALLVICSICAWRRSRKAKRADIDGFYPVLDLTTIGGLTLFLIFCGFILALAFTGEKPFVYFQF